MKNKKITILVFSLLFATILGIYYLKPFLVKPNDIKFNFVDVEGTPKEIEDLHYIAMTEYDTVLKMDITPKGTKQLGNDFLGSIYTLQSPDIER